MREKRILFWGLILAVVVLLNLPPASVLRVSSTSRDGVAPFQNTMTLVLHHARNLLTRLGRTGLLVKENEALEVRIANLEHRIRRLDHFEDENRELRRQLGFSILSPRKLLLSEVITRGDMSGWWQTVRLNKGSSSGVTPGMAVMTTEGLIGRTIEVSERTSDVLLITDPNCRVSCKTVPGGAFGIMRGGGVQLVGHPLMEMLASINPAVLTYISTGQDIHEGDEVLTSGLGGVFPEGLPVGRIGRVRPHGSGLYLQAEVIPTAKLDSFRYAFVVLEAMK